MFSRRRRWLRWPWSEGHSFEAGPRKPMRYDSTDCVLEEFVNFDLEISVIVSGNGKDVTVSRSGKYPPQQHPLSKTIVPIAFQKV